MISQGHPVDIIWMVLLPRKDTINRKLCEWPSRSVLCDRNPTSGRDGKGNQSLVEIDSSGCLLRQLKKLTEPLWQDINYDILILGIGLAVQQKRSLGLIFNNLVDGKSKFCRQISYSYFVSRENVGFLGLFLCKSTWAAWARFILSS